MFFWGGGEESKSVSMYCVKKKYGKKKEGQKLTLG